MIPADAAAWRAWLHRTAKLIAETTVVVGAVAGLMTVGETYLAPPLQRVLGVSTLAERMREVENRLEALEPAPRVAVYDVALSFVDGPCVIGERCTGVFRVRRTAGGAECLAPVISPVVINHGGRTHPARFLGGGGRALVDQYTTFEVHFRVPETARAGRAVLRLNNDYTCGERQVAETTPPLAFDLINPS